MQQALSARGQIGLNSRTVELETVHVDDVDIGPQPLAEDAAAAEQASRDLSRYYGLFATWFRNENPIRRGFIEPPTDEELAAMTMYAPETLRETLVIGTPDEVIARLKRYESMGYDQYSFWIDNGLPFEAKRGSLERFIREVMPAFT